MAVLSGPEIQRLVESGSIVITPFEPKRVNSNSYNLRLSPTLTVYEKGMAHHNYMDQLSAACRLKSNLLKPWQTHHVPEDLDMAVAEKCISFEIPKHGFVMYPGVLYLGSTMEYTETPDHKPTIDGRSSVGRLGLTTHVTAGFGDQGFKGTWTLELSVVQPLRVYAGVEICQISYETIVGEPKPYAGKYQGQRPPQPSGLWREFQQHGKTALLDQQL